MRKRRNWVLTGALGCVLACAGCSSSTESTGGTLATVPAPTTSVVSTVDSSVASTSAVPTSEAPATTGATTTDPAPSTTTVPPTTPPPAPAPAPAPAPPPAPAPAPAPAPPPAPTTAPPTTAPPAPAPPNQLRRITFEEIRVVSDCDGPGGAGDFTFEIGATGGPEPYSREFGRARDRLRLDNGDSITIGDRYEVDVTDGNVPIIISFRATETDLGRVDLEESAEVRASSSGEIVLSRPTGFGDFACRVLLEYDVDTIAF